MPTTPDAHDEPRAEVIASRMRLILDYVKATEDHEPTFSEIQSKLKARDVHISRARWSYLINGHRLVEDNDLYDALADIFGVTAGFLRGETDVPEHVAAKMDLVRAMRAAQVRTYAARSLGDVAPDAMRAITEILDQHANQTGKGDAP